jgi:hypothetical protein
VIRYKNNSKGVGRRGLAKNNNNNNNNNNIYLTAVGLSPGGSGF